MKLNEHSLINVVDSKDFKEHHIKYTDKNLQHLIKHYDEAVKVHGEDFIDGFVTKEFLYTQKITRRLIFSKKSLSNLENYKVPKDIRVEVLRTLPNREDIIQLSENEVIRYVKTNENVIVTINKDNGRYGGITTFYFSINLETGKVWYDNYDYGHKEFIDLDEMKEKYYNKFMIVVTYLELTPVTYNVIEGGRSYGTLKNDKIKNLTNKRFIMVNTNWNVETIRITDIHVRGHWRLQPHGVGRSQYKYIYIQPFDKGITRRQPQKELV